MMVLVRRTILLGLVMVLVLSACGQTDSGTLAGNGSGSNPSQLSLTEADQVVQTFLNGWQSKDYLTMYNLISPNSRDAFSLEAFTEEYETAANGMGLLGMTSLITSSLRQGTTAAVMYDVTFDSGIFGTIEDPGRTMRLLETPEGWRIAWSRMDIFAELAEGARLELRRTQPNRGNIYDRNGRTLADENGKSVLLYGAQQNMPDVDACIREMARILSQEYADMALEFARWNPDTLFLVGEIDPETYANERATLSSVCGITDDDAGERPTRRYFADVAPHIVGYVGRIQEAEAEEYAAKGYPADALVGQEGIEKSYEDYLAGKMGGRLVIAAPTGETLRVIAESAAEPGQSVYLTIDRDLQAAVQLAFKEAYDESIPTWSNTSPGAAAVVMDVNTGEVLAAVSYPGYSPGLFNPNSPVYDPAQEIANLKSDWRTPLFNRVTRGLYPAGSVFKIVSMAAGLDSGVYSVDKWFTCNGIWYGGNYGDALTERTDWIYPGSHGSLNFIGALTNSCDPYFWELGVNLHNTDPNLLPDYAHMMGIGVATGQTDLPEELGYVPNPGDYFDRTGSDWAMGDTLNLVIGQGRMQITPLQIARMVTAVANGGTMYVPRFVKEVKIIGEEPVYAGAPQVESVLDFDPSVFAAIQQSMCEVTTAPTGTARYIFEEWYNFQGTDVVICGKTGTAQTGGENTPPQAWFAAFAPQDEPEIAIAVIVENSCEGSEVAAPIVRRIVEDYYGMQHSVWPPLWQEACTTLAR